MSAPDRSTRLNAIWRDLIGHYPALSLPIDFFFSPSTWRMLGSDMMPSAVKNGRARRAAARLEGVSEDDLDALISMAKINAGRAADTFRAVAVCYITVPIALAALVSETAPDLVRDLLRTNIDQIMFWVIAAALTPAIYFCGMWRAKQLHWTLELYKAGAIEPLHPRPARGQGAKT